MSDPAEPSQRLDKWLWYARFFKTRGLATKVVQAGNVRIDGTRVSKPSRAIQSGVILTFPQADDVRVVKVIELGQRRGPAAEAQALYQDLTPKQEKSPPNPRYEGKGRPTKRDRRTMRLHKFQ